MKTRYLICSLALCTMMFGACKKNDDGLSKAEFGFGQLAQEAIVSGANGADIAFFAMMFDANPGTWEIKILDKSGAEKPSSIISIEKLMQGYIQFEKVKVSLRSASSLPLGDYTLAIKNRHTGQTHVESFKVVERNSEVAQNMSGYNASHLNMSASNDAMLHPKYVYTKGDEIYLPLTANVDMATVTGVRFVRKDGDTEFGLDITKDTHGISFTLPTATGTPAGWYYVLVEFNHVMSDVSYCTTTIGLMDKTPLPEITAINGETFRRGETIIITGRNFRFAINDMFWPNKYMKQLGTETCFGFDIGGLTIYAQSLTIDTEGTRIECNVGKIFDEYLGAERNVEGSATVQTYIGSSNAKPIKIIAN